MEQRVAAVDDGVARLEQSRQRIDALVHRRSCFDHQEDRAGRVEDLDELLERGGGLEVALPPVRSHELVRPLASAVVDTDPHAMRGEVAGQVHAHGRQPDDAKLVIFHFTHPRHYANRQQPGGLAAKWRV